MLRDFSGFAGLSAQLVELVEMVHSGGMIVAEADLERVAADHLRAGDSNIGHHLIAGDHATTCVFVHAIGAGALESELGERQSEFFARGPH